MDIQRMMWPQVGVCTCSELYVRLNKKANLIEPGKLLLERQGAAWFDTYFNSVSIGKWRKYTKIKRVGLRIELEGTMKVTLYRKRMVQNRIEEQALKEEIVTRDTRGSWEIEFPEVTTGMLFFRLEALQAQAVYYGGAYTAKEEESRREVKIGIVICTFQREEFIRKTIRIVKESFLENPKSLLKDKLEVFLSDNGKTLSREEFETDTVHLFPNKNVGGSGGFTRGMMEIWKRNQFGGGITHVLLMDDDVVLAPESMEKTWQVLSWIKEEYREAWIGGAMLRMDQPSLQVEAGASWNGGKLRSLKSGLDLRYVEACLCNEVEEFTEYQAWWYCCFPVEVIRKENLPLPFFIRGDDVEYGLRNQPAWIGMNGISLWHEPFEQKYASFLNYYILRNQWITNSLHCPQYGKNEMKKELFRRITEEILFYRYRNVDLLLRGIEDFLKGPAWLFRTDGEALHKEIIAMGYQAKAVEELEMRFSYPEYQRSLLQKESKCGRWIRKISGNGYWGRWKKEEERIVSMTNPRYCNVWKATRVMYYDAVSEKGFLTQRSWKEAVRCYKKMGKVFRKIEKRYETVKKEYRMQREKLTSFAFWERYLKDKKSKSG